MVAWLGAKKEIKQISMYKSYISTAKPFDINFYLTKLFDISLQQKIIIFYNNLDFIITNILIFLLLSLFNLQ